jgi:hypothetical protein
MRKSFVFALLVLSACGDDSSTQRRLGDVDAAMADAVQVDGRLSCADFPYPQDPMCPAPQPFCCFYSLESPFYCSTDPTSVTTGDMCREQPVGGLLQACDAATGAGCPSDGAICCSEQLSNDTFTYCTDHAYRGPGWTCSQ